jgi:hypothetical protein
MLGNWTGTYTYLGNRLPEKVRNLETKFHIKINEFDGLNFSGIVEEDGATGGMSGIGKIEGKIENGMVYFVKRMPNLSVYFPDGTKVNEDKPHRKIYYSGKLEGEQLAGIWKFKFGFGKVKNRLTIFPRSKGKWEMKKDQ